MDGLCSEGRRENAVSCCVCKFPLLLFCEEHLREHRTKPGLHFTLPLRVQFSIVSKDEYFLARDWLTRLGYNFEALRERVEELSRSEEQIDVVYDELQQRATDIKTRLKEEFALVKMQFQRAVESAIKETSDNALDTQSFVPADAFSQLLWVHDSRSIAKYQIYTFQANNVKKFLDSAFQVELRFVLPGFEHWKVGQLIQPSSGRIQDELQDIRRDAVALEQRNSALQKENSDLADQVKVKNDEISQQALNLAWLQKELEMKNNELQTVCRDKDMRISALEKELNNAATLAKGRDNQLAELTQEKAALINRLQTKEDQLTAANSKIAETEQRFIALATENKRLGEQVSELQSQFQGLSMAQVQAGPLPATAEPCEKLIAVLKGEVKLFNVATSQWQQLCALRKEIYVSDGTSSTFIAPHTIFVCGGKDSSTCHVDSDRAYVLQADNGSVQKLRPMSDGRCWPGVAWDSERKALYVFGGLNRGTCYTVPLRTSEMFLSNEWSLLADMHQGREYFNPCWHCCLVYLCGGWGTNSVETYDPRSNTFARQDFILPENTQTTAVVECGVLTVVSRYYISKLQQGKLTSQQHPEYWPWSNCTPVVTGGAVYIVNLYKGYCRCIDLTTGTLRKEVSSS